MARGLVGGLIVGCGGKRSVLVGAFSSRIAAAATLTTAMVRRCTAKWLLVRDPLYFGDRAVKLDAAHYYWRVAGAIGYWGGLIRLK